MKKLICIALTLVMTLSLAACGGNETADTQTDKLSGAPFPFLSRKTMSPAAGA